MRLAQPAQARPYRLHVPRRVIAPLDPSRDDARAFRHPHAHVIARVVAPRAQRGVQQSRRAARVPDRRRERRVHVASLRARDVARARVRVREVSVRAERARGARARHHRASSNAVASVRSRCFGVVASARLESKRRASRARERETGVGDGRSRASTNARWSTRETRS